MAGAHDVRADAEHAGRGGALGAEGLVAIAETARAALGVRGHLAERSESGAAARGARGRDRRDARERRRSARARARARSAGRQGLGLAQAQVAALGARDGAAAGERPPALARLGSRPPAASAGGFRDGARRAARSSPCAPARASAVPGIVHDTSNSGQTLFVEPFAIVELSNRLRELEGDERDEVARILAELSRHVGAYAEELEHAVDVLAAIDLALACGALSRGWRGCPIEPSDDVELIAARHPLLDPATVVPVDLPLAGVRVLVLSGANTGGKTVALKTLGLCALLHQCGLHVPARARAPARLRRRARRHRRRAVDRGLALDVLGARPQPRPRARGGDAAHARAARRGRRGHRPDRGRGAGARAARRALAARRADDHDDALRRGQAVGERDARRAQRRRRLRRGDARADLHAHARAPRPVARARDREPARARRRA